MAYIKAVSRVAVRKSNNGKYLLPLLFPRLNKSLCKPGAWTVHGSRFTTATVLREIELKGCLSVASYLYNGSRGKLDFQRTNEISGLKSSRSYHGDKSTR